MRTSILNLRRERSLQHTDLEGQVHYLETEKQVMTQALLHTRSNAVSANERLESDKKQLVLYRDRMTALESALESYEKDIALGREVVEEKTKRAESLRTEELAPLRSDLQMIEEMNRKFSLQDSENQKELSNKERLVVHYKLELVHQQERIESLRGRIEDDFGLIELEYKNEYSKSTPLPFPDLVIETLPVIKELPDGIEEPFVNRRIISAALVL